MGQTDPLPSRRRREYESHLEDRRGVILVALGGIWFLQGIGVLPGSFMSGQIRWAAGGGIAVAPGISILVPLGNR